MTGTQQKTDSSTYGTTVNSYGNTTTKNPFVTSKTTNKGTTTNFNSGAFNDVYKYINDNVNDLLEQYRNPTLDSASNQAKINAYNKTVSENTEKSLNNDIINQLYNRGLIRSSAANDMYNHLLEENAKNYSDFTNSLLAENTNEVGKQIELLRGLYGDIYNAVLSNQAQSLQTSSGNATTTKDSKTKGSVG